MKRFFLGAILPAICFAVGVLAGSLEMRGYVVRHRDEIYRQGANDMKVAIFGALDRITQEPRK